jgi:hypothetical protein
MRTLLIAALVAALGSPAFAGQGGVTRAGVKYTKSGPATKGVTPSGVKYTSQTVTNEKGSFKIYKGLGCGKKYGHGNIEVLKACQARVLSGGQP